MKDPALVLTLPGGLEMAFQLIPEGTFRMGSRGETSWEEPIHSVQITKPFYLGTYPVTQEQFAAWKQDHENRFENRPTHPAENVTWDEAVAFCDWLTEFCSQVIPAEHVVALPSEAQWEYACRAGKETEYYTGDGEAALAEAGWYGGNSDNSTQPVGLLQPNEFQLYDMHGNVREWCHDAHEQHAYKRRVNGVCDPKTAGDDGSNRVVRGGSWGYTPWSCRAACRGRWRPTGRVGASGSVWSPVRAQASAEGAEPVSGGVARRDDAAKP